ncbi:MAG: hypothetical protein M1821_002019 [Bathelium mastoideum]|nr:MAG: hypothetical protein M1821_002019 [Bathelium mastoideum]KAI9692525.1 MAG: hypothetical protein M1822_006756 [Bathelium mastoideum]
MTYLSRRVSLNFRPRTAAPAPEYEQELSPSSSISAEPRWKWSASKASLDRPTVFHEFEDKSASEDVMQVEDGEPQKRARKASLQEATNGFKTVMRRASVSAKSAWHVGTGKRKSRDQGSKTIGPSRSRSDGIADDKYLFKKSLLGSGSSATSSAQEAPPGRWTDSKWARLKMGPSGPKGIIYGKHDSSIRVPQASSFQAPLASHPTKFPASTVSPIYVPQGGDAARASAAAATQFEAASEVSFTHQLVRHDTMSTRSLYSSVPKDDESGVCIDMDIEDDVQKDAGLDITDSLSTVPRKDFIKDLPAELGENILSCLDALSLTTIERVNKCWQQAARSHHIWRNLFLSEYGHNPYPVQKPLLPVGAAGIGRREPQKDWRLMYKARKEIERNWRTGNGSAIYLSGHTDSVYCVQFDDQKLITGSRDRTIRVWDLHNYQCLKVIGGPSSKPIEPHKYQKTVDKHTVFKATCVNGTPYGNAIFHAPRDFHSASVLCLQYDSEIMVTGSSDNTCIVWDVKTFQPIRRLFRHTAGVLDICFDDKHIISCSKDASIIVWDRATGAVVRTLLGHRGPVNAVQLRGNLLVSASGDGVARLWNIDSGSCIREFASRDRGLAAVEFSDDARYVLAGGNDQVIYKFDARTGDLVATYRGHEALVRSLFLDTRNNRIVSGSYDLSLRVYDYEKGTEVATFPQWTTSWMLSAKSDYRRIVSTSQDGRILIVDFGHKVEGAELLEDSSWAKGFEEARIARRTFPRSKWFQW